MSQSFTVYVGGPAQYCETSIDVLKWWILFRWWGSSGCLCQLPYHDARMCKAVRHSGNNQAQFSLMVEENTVQCGRRCRRCLDVMRESRHEVLSRSLAVDHLHVIDPTMFRVGHLKSFAPEDPIPCPHAQCKAAGLVLSNAMVFKDLTATVHKIFWRA